jgi:hypothetical protein
LKIDPTINSLTNTQGKANVSPAREVASRTAPPSVDVDVAVDLSPMTAEARRFSAKLV